MIEIDHIQTDTRQGVGTKNDGCVIVDFVAYRRKRILAQDKQRRLLNKWERKAAEILGDE